MGDALPLNDTCDCLPHKYAIGKQYFGIAIQICLVYSVRESILVSGIMQLLH